MNTFGGGIEAHIHQIWIGPNPIPYIWIDTVKHFCLEQNIQYTLWDETLIESSLDWGIVPGMRDLYNSLDTFAGKGDILRYMILYQYGGMYIDADSVLIRPAKFVKFLAKNSAGLFMAWEEFGKADKNWIRTLGNKNRNIQDKTRLIANGTIGARKGHPFLKKLLEELKSNSDRLANKQDWRKTGPAFVTNMYAKYENRYNDIKIYPMKYFYPISWKGIKDPEAHKRMRFPPESMFFQYGYSTNNFAKIFRNLTRKRRRN